MSFSSRQKNRWHIHRSPNLGQDGIEGGPYHLEEAFLAKVFVCFLSASLFSGCVRDKNAPLTSDENALTKTVHRVLTSVSHSRNRDSTKMVFVRYPLTILSLRWRRTNLFPKTLARASHLFSGHEIRFEDIFFRAFNRLA